VGSNPFSLFSLFTLIPYFFSFLFFPALRRVDFFEKIGVNVKFYEGNERVIGDSKVL
jgi:hypothetical protein